MEIMTEKENYNPFDLRSDSLLFDGISTKKDYARYKSAWVGLGYQLQIDTTDFSDLIDFSKTKRNKVINVR